jgi:hypothetical protein
MRAPASMLGTNARQLNGRTLFNKAVMSGL